MGVVDPCVDKYLTFRRNRPGGICSFMETGLYLIRFVGFSLFAPETKSGELYGHLNVGIRTVVSLLDETSTIALKALHIED